MVILSMENQVGKNALCTLLKLKLQLLMAIQVAIYQGYHVVFFATDCRTVVDALSSHNFPHNELGDII
ncbi:hypothetical protein A2U01_0093686, partial [Trifolium medium]|nr:hypothetical protein [Trifolium medium]